MKRLLSRCWSFKFNKGLPRRCRFHGHIDLEIPKVPVNGEFQILHISKNGTSWTTPLPSVDTEDSWSAF